MKKSELLSLNWLKTVPVTTCGHEVTIRELSAAKRQAIRAKYHALKETDEQEANECLVRDYCFWSVVDEDGVLVFESDEEQKQGLELLPDQWFADVFKAVGELNDMGVKSDEEVAKKSEQSTEAQTISSGSDGSVENSVTRVSAECCAT